MNTQEAIKILRNTAWLGTNENREKTEQAVEVVAEALDQDKIIYCKDCKFIRRLGYEGYNYCALEDRPNRNWSVDETDFCSWAERKLEQSQNCVKCKYYCETEDDTGVHSQCRATCSKTAQVKKLRKAAEETEDNGVRKGILKAIEVLEGDTE